MGVRSPLHVFDRVADPGYPTGVQGGPGRVKISLRDFAKHMKTYTLSNANSLSRRRLEGEEGTVV